MYSWYSQVAASKTSETSTSVTYSCTLGYYTKYSINVYANGKLSGMASGSWSGSMTASSNSGTKKTVLTKSVTISKGSSSTTKTLTGYVQATGGFGNGKSTASVTVTIPAIDYDAPNAPSGCTATRNSDSKATVKWTNGSTSTTKPRTRTYVYRATDDSSSYTQLGYVGSSTTSYTDSSISANHRYRYRVRAYGNGGYSSYATSSYIYTTPAAPSSVTIARTGDGTAIQVSATTSNAKYATSWDVQYRVDSGDWTSYGSVTAFPVTFTPDAGTIQVRVRSVRSSLSSGWTTSGTVQTLMAPNAPAVTIAGGANVLPTGGTVTVTWTPNHPDGTAQSQAQVEYQAGGDPTTIDVTGAGTTVTLPDTVTDEPCVIQARVRTHGSYDGWGEWSGYATVTVYDPPTASITGPEDDDYVLREMPLEITWDATDATGISSQTLSITDMDGSTIWRATLAGDVRAYTYTAGDQPLENQTTYTIGLTVSAGSSLSTTTSRSFATDWLEPLTPAVEYEVIEESLSVELTVRNGTDEDETEAGLPEAVSFAVYRQIGSDTWTVDTGLAEGESVQDPLPPLNVPFSYLIVGTSASGSTSTLTVEMTVDSNGMEALSFGQGAGETILLGYNTTGSVSIDHGGTAYSFATGGDSLPVYYPTGELEGSVSRSYETFDMDLYRRVLRLGRAYPECWLRDYDGARHMGQVSISGSLKQGFGTVRGVDVDMTECAFEEAW